MRTEEKLDEEYSLDAKSAMDLFVSEYTEYIFYVEDTNAEVFYERLFGLIFPKLVEYIVVCLHGKSNVQKKVFEKRAKGLKYLFVVDKDFDDLLGAPLNDEFVYLDRYCIENYLADLNALTRVYVEEYPVEKTIKAILTKCNDYADYIDKLNKGLINATRYFVVVRKHYLEIQNSKLPIEQLIDGGNEYHPMPTEEWILDYRKSVLAESGLSEVDLDLELASALIPSGDFPDATTNDIFHVPGKHLFDCLLKFFSIRTNPGFENRLKHSLYTRVLNHVDINNFEKLKIRLIFRESSLQQYT